MILPPRAWISWRFEAVFSNSRSRGARTLAGTRPSLRRIGPGARRADGEAGERGELGGEGLGRGDADLGPGVGAQGPVGLAGEAALGDVDDGERLVPAALEVAQRRQRVGRLARLRDQEPALAE